jgi:hypothetical protein
LVWRQEQKGKTEKIPRVIVTTSQVSTRKFTIQQTSRKDLPIYFISNSTELKVGIGGILSNFYFDTCDACMNMKIYLHVNDRRKFQLLNALPEIGINNKIDRFDLLLSENEQIVFI